MKHFILGTAGHVDHGKSSLIKALTNVETDRLPEEKERGLSIDLGFAPLPLEDPEGQGDPIHLGVVDVPGHHRFLRNMIAGVGGFDAAILVVDCCEGVKPQTYEHLKILELLQTKRGLVVLSKADKSDEDGLEIARWELEETLAGSFLEGAPILATSAHSGLGVPELKAELYKLFASCEARNSSGIARLPVDRAFSKTGFGDVVTGSLWSGTLQVGDDVEVLPQGLRGKVRGLQMHGGSMGKATPGQRLAVNLSGLDKGGLKRGQTLVSPPGSLPVAERFAASFTVVCDNPKFLKKKFRGTFFQGASHHQVSVNLVAESGESVEAFGQILFSNPVLLCRGDRFLLRDETDENLLAGGTILGGDERPFRRSRAPQFLKRFQALAGGGEVGRALQFVDEQGGFVKMGALKKHQGLSQSEWDERLALLLESGRLIQLGKDRLWNQTTLEEMACKVETLLSKLAEAAKWKSGWAFSEMASLLGMKSGKDKGLEDLVEYMEGAGRLKRVGPYLSPPNHEPSLSKTGRQAASRALELLEGDSYSPRDWEHCLQEVSGGDKKLNLQLEEYLLSSGQVIRLSEKLVTTPAVLQQARLVLKENEGEGFTASEARQMLNTSRKFIIPILEWMDREGWTVRLGDARKMAALPEDTPSD